MRDLWRKLTIVLVLVLLLGNTTYALAATRTLAYQVQEPHFTLFKSNFTIAPDKEKHILAGMSIMAGSDLLHLKHGMEYVLAAGIGKEVFDYFNGGDVDIKDTLATIVGGLVYEGIMRLNVGHAENPQ